ncbi:MAG TPA: hypothetical protein VGI66_00260 [Streptosporangiaceae bacterium]
MEHLLASADALLAGRYAGRPQLRPILEAVVMAAQAGGCSTAGTPPTAG